MIASVYARKSTSEEGKADDDKSCAVQIKLAKEYAAKRGWRVDDRYVYQDEAISGAEYVKRPGLTALLTALKTKPPFDVLIVRDHTRLGRGQTVRTMALIQTITDAGVQVWGYASDREMALDTDLGEVDSFMQSWAAGQYRKKVSADVRAAMRVRAQAGKPTGWLPFGYNRDRTINREQAAVIRRIFKRRLEGAGLYKIARELEADKVSTSDGVGGWHPTTIRDILNRELYAGVQVYGRTQHVYRAGTSKTIKTPDAVIRTKAEHLRIIDQKTWDAVQRINEQASAKTVRRADGKLLAHPTLSKYLLTGLLRCDHCGSSLSARRCGKRMYYFCVGRHLLGKKKCPSAHMLRMDSAETFVVGEYRRALLAQTILTRLEEDVAAWRSRATDPRPLRAEAAKLKQQIGRLVDALEDGDMPAREVRERIRDRKAKLEHVEGLLQGSADADAFDIDKHRRDLQAIMANWGDYLLKNQTTSRTILVKVLGGQRVAAGWDAKRRCWYFDLPDVSYDKLLAEAGLDEWSRLLKESAPAMSKGVSNGVPMTMQ